MKKYFLLLTALFTFLRANPTDPTEFYINEVFIEDSSWVIELPIKFTHSDETLLDYLQDTLIVRTHNDSIYYPIKKIEFYAEYCCLYSDSVSDFLYLNPEYQLLQLKIKDTSEFSYHSQLIWGVDSLSMSDQKNPSIAENTSLSRENDNIMSPEFLFKYYLDSSPTIGVKNDSVNATGKLVISVTDSCDSPMPAEIIGLGIWETDFFGQKEYNLLTTYYDISIKPYYSANINDWQQAEITIYPDSTQYLNFVFPVKYSSIDNNTKIADQFILSQNYPNPFNPTTTITFTLPGRSPVRLKIFNLQGHLLEELVSESLGPGAYRKTWDAAEYPSGIYIYQLETPGVLLQRKCLLVK